jgi:hypothetical protein
MGGWLTVIGIEVTHETKNAAAIPSVSTKKRALPLFFIKTSALRLLSPEIPSPLPGAGPPAFVTVADFSYYQHNYYMSIN